MNVMDIGEVVDRAGVPPSTLRYYEELGLISSIGRHGLRRQFGPQVLLQLSLIALGKSAGFSLGEIAAMFDEDGQPCLPRPDLHARADALSRQAQSLAALGKVLRHVAECPAPSHLECPSFQRLLRIAARRGPKAHRETRAGSLAGDPARHRRQSPSRQRPNGSS